MNLESSEKHVAALVCKWRRKSYLEGPLGGRDGGGGGLRRLRSLFPLAERGRGPDLESASGLGAEVQRHVLVCGQGRQ